ncbi:MAG TPA: hypothetical protein VGN05_03795 [Parvibaculum sp.]|jgi:hypothetical protein
MNAMTKSFEAPKALWSGAQGPAALAEMMRLALEICDLLEDEGEEGRVALAFAALNRMRRFGPDGEGCALRQERDIFDPALCRALAVACLVLSGGVDDPTEGATHFHLHTEQPKWARIATPKALIGRYIFHVLEPAPNP